METEIELDYGKKEKKRPDEGEERVNIRPRECVQRYDSTLAGQKDGRTNGPMD